MSEDPCFYDYMSLLRKSFSPFSHCWSTVNKQVNMFAVFDYHTVSYQGKNQFKQELVIIFVL